jgi:hypothetical protein
LSIQPGFHVYAHCDPAKTGGVSVLAINTSRDRPRAVILPLSSERYTLGATRLQSTAVQLNGRTLALDAGDALPRIAAIPTPSGVVALEPATITFLAIPSAANPACH